MHVDIRRVCGRVLLGLLHAAEFFATGDWWLANRSGCRGGFLRSNRQAVTVAHRAAMSQDLVHLLLSATGGRVVGNRVIEHGPGNFAGDRAVAGDREAEILAGDDRASEDVAKHVEFLVVEQRCLGGGDMSAVQFDRGVLEVVAHPGDALGADRIDVAVVRQALGEMAVDEALRDIEHHAVLECTMALDPPGVPMVPHAHPLSMPGGVFAGGIPAGDIDVVHSAIVEWRAFGFVAFAGHMAGGHVADPDDCQIADLAFLDEVDDLLVVPGVAIEKIDGNHLAGGFDRLNQFPLGLGVNRDGLLGDHVQAGGQCFAHLSGTGICQSEQAHGVETLISEDLVLVGDDSGRGNSPAGQFARGRVHVTDIADVPQLALLHHRYKATTHSAKADNANAKLTIHSGFRTPEGSVY